MTTHPPFRKVLDGVATREEMFQLFNHHRDNPDFDPLSGKPYAGEWFEIEAAQYHFMLGLLPPLFQRTGMFGMSEYKAGNVTSVFFAIRIRGREHWFHGFCDLTDRQSPDKMRAAIIAHETGATDSMTREESSRRSGMRRTRTSRASPARPIPKPGRRSITASEPFLLTPPDTAPSSSFWRICPTKRSTSECPQSEHDPGKEGKTMRTQRKQPLQAPKHTYEAHSTYTAGLGMPDRRQYRRTPPGAPTVADLVRPGDTVAPSYNTGGIVVEVKEYFYAAPTGETLSHFTIVYVPADRATKYRDTDHHWINECVAVDGRILMLFEANSDEVFVVDQVQPADPQPSRTILIT